MKPETRKMLDNLPPESRRKVLLAAIRVWDKLMLNPWPGLRQGKPASEGYKEQKEEGERGGAQ